MGVIKLLFALMRVALRDIPLNEEEKAACTQEQVEALYSLASRHDVAHLLAFGLQKSGLPLPDKLRKSILTAIYRTQQQKTDLSQICQILEDAQIPFVPLKGSVLRERYPEPWMRTSCDIDVLVSPENLAAAQASLEAQGYVVDGGCGHDVSLHSPRGTHLELHFDLIEESRNTKMNAVLCELWSVVRPCTGHQYQMAMPDAYFYFYHVAHMVKHFETGGCGIRPLIDLWILNQAKPADVDALLDKGQILSFARAMTKLSRHWLEAQPADEATMRVQHYILTGGVYGTTQNSIALKQQRAGGTRKYAWQRIFPPYAVMKTHYPVLEKCCVLLPIFYVFRWFHRLFEGKLKRSVNELKINQSISSEQQENFAQLLQDVGL